MDDRDVNLAVLVDVTDQDVNTFNLYLLYFAWWFSEKILPQTGEVDIHYVYFTDEVVYAGSNPYDHFGFEVEEDDQGAVQPVPMDELPMDVDPEYHSNVPNTCYVVASLYPLCISSADTRSDRVIPFQSHIPSVTHSLTECPSVISFTQCIDPTV